MLAGVGWAVTSISLTKARVEEHMRSIVVIAVTLAVAILGPALVLVQADGIEGAARAWLIGNAVAAVVAFTTALDADPAGPAADRLLLDSLRSPDRLVHGAALRAIRRGAGTGALAGHLIPHLAALPAATRAGLLEALAARPGPADDLHAFLLEQSENASPAT